MAQFQRRITFWIVIVALIAAGAIIQARASDSPRSSEETSLKTDPDAEYATEEKALLQQFRCAMGVVSLNLRLAEKECDRAITLSPQESLGYKYRGLLYLLEHRFEKAELDFQQATTLYPNDAESQAGYAQALSRQGRFGDALVRFNAAIMLTPADARFLSARCWAIAAQGKSFSGP
jgi:Flp pilus assembly protein TadD